MSLWDYIQIEILPILALAVVLYLSLTGFQSFQNNQRFRVLIILVMCILAVDIGNWYTVLKPFALPVFFAWFFNIFYFLLTEIIAFFWFSYVYNQINENNLSARQKKLLKLSVIPMLVVCLIILGSPWNHMIFYINPLDHTYHRGVLHLIQFFCGFGYMLAASVLAYKRSLEVQLMEQKKEYRFLCFVVFLPFIGGILQMLNYYFVFLWPFTAGAIFLMYTDLQKHQISVDPLTSLNNRGNLERYLQQKITNRDNGWYMIMIDVDYFKTINDKFGHMAGDRVLQILANSLKAVFGSTDAFISRYGGDEFMIIAEAVSTEALDGEIKRCRDEFDKQLKEENDLYNVEISVGYAQYIDADKTPVQEMLKKADARMYAHKRKEKGAE